MDNVDEAHLQEQRAGLPDIPAKLNESGADRNARLERRLEASRRATRLIFAADSAASLIERTCQNFVKTLGYAHAWIALLEEDVERATAIAMAGLGGRTQGMRQRLESGRCGEFLRRVARADGLFVVRESLDGCASCPLSDQYATCAGLARGLRFDGKLFGIVSVSVSTEYAHDPDEQAFFNEMADDVAFALHRMEQDSELRLATEIVNGSPSVALVWDKTRERSVRYASENAPQLLGYAPNELISGHLGFADLVHPADLPQVLREAEAAAKDPDVVMVQHQPYRIVTRSGEIKWVQDMTTIERSEAGDVELYRGLLLDISERKAAEERLRQSERFLDSVVNGIADPIFVKDEQHRWIALNDAFCRMFGRTREEMLGKSDADFFPAEEVEVFWEHDDKVLSSDGIDVNEESITGPDGTRTISTIKSAFTDPGTGRRVLVGTIRDITEQKAAEDALRRSEAKLRKAQRIAKLGSWTADLRTQMIHASEEMLNLVRRHDEQIDALPIAEWKTRIHPDDVDRVELALAKARSGEESYDLEYRIIRDDGQTRALHVQGEYIRDTNGNLIRMEGTGQDVTERRLAQEELQDSQNRLRSIFDQTFQFAGIVALDGTLLGANQTSLRFVDTEEEQVIEKPFWLTPWWRHDSEQQGWLKRSVARAAAGHSVEGEVTHVSSHGKLHYFDFSLKPVIDEQDAPRYLIAESRDVTARRLAEQKMKRLLGQQVAINDLSIALGNEHQLESVYRTIHEYVSRMVDTRGLTISLLGPDGLLHVTFAVDGDGVLDATGIPNPEALEGTGPLGEVVRSGLPQRTGRCGKNHAGGDLDPLVDKTGSSTEQSALTCLLAPMKVGGVVIGVLRVDSIRLNAYSKEDEDLLAGLANVAAIAIENSRLQGRARADAAELRSAFRGTIEILARAAERRDPYTAGHQLRVALLSAEIAKELGFSEEGAETVRIAAMVHDIGKLSIPAEILSRPSKLNAMEYELVRSHVDAAYDILKTIDFPWPVADIVSQHHERLDGSGYPNGLRDDEILLEAQIIAVADVVEAMSHHRPYRPSLGIDAALQEIEAKKGVCYGTEVVDACLRLYEAGFELPDDILQ